MGCCYSLFKDLVRLCILCLALAGAGLAVVALPHLTPKDLWSAPAESLWFPLSLATLGALLLALGLVASCGSWGTRTATLHLFNGATLVLLPGELGLSAIWWSGSPLLRRFALLDTSNTFTALLDWLGANKALATLAGAAFLCLQLAVLVLGTCVGCCTPAPRKYPWSQYWDDPRVSGGWEARDPLLPQLTRSAPTSAGYHTPPSRFLSPNPSPDRPPRTVHFASPVQAPSPPQGIPPHVAQRVLASFPVAVGSVGTSVGSPME